MFCKGGVIINIALANEMPDVLLKLKLWQLDRKPSMCVVFEDDPRGITAAHNCTMKATALIGAHPAYVLGVSLLCIGFIVPWNCTINTKSNFSSNSYVSNLCCLEIESVSIK